MLFYSYPFFVGLDRGLSPGFQIQLLNISSEQKESRDSKERAERAEIAKRRESRTVAKIKFL